MKIKIPLRRVVYFSAILLLVLSVFGCYGASYAYQVNQLGCLMTECAPERHFGLSVFGLPATLFPENAVVGLLGPADQESDSIDAASQVVYWSNLESEAQLVVYRYASVDKAIEAYDALEGPYLPFKKVVEYVPDPEEELVRGDMLSWQGYNRQNTALVEFVACIQGDNGYCVEIMRYEEFVFFFKSTIDQRMSFGAFRKVFSWLNHTVSLNFSE